MAAADDRTRHYNKLRPVEDEATREARQRAYQVQNLRPLLDSISPTAKVVEIGPGRGVTAKLLREWGLRNYLAIEVCEEYVSELTAQGFDCRLADDASESLLQSVPDGSCDYIMAIDVLEHMELDACRFLLTAAKRKLASGGKLIVQVPNASAPFGINTHLADPTHLLPFNDVRLVSLLRSAGFDAVRALPVQLPRSPANMVRGLVQRLVFGCVKMLTRAIGATPVGVMTHLMLGVAVAPEVEAKSEAGRPLVATPLRIAA
jgi:predicted TPR repeat methyltransferase